MSAVIVPQAHIDALITAGLVQGRILGSPLRWYRGSQARTLTPESASEVGQMLWAENLRSVNYRYPDTRTKIDDIPGPADFTEADVVAYHYDDTTLGGLQHRVNPLKALRALDGYEYQACEAADWRQTEARWFCEALRHRLITMLPGYDRGPWSVTSVSDILTGPTVQPDR